MRESASVLYNKVHKTHTYLIHILENFRKEHAAELNPYENVDATFALRESIAFLEDLIKELKKDQQRAVAKVGYLALQDECPMKLGTMYCTGTVQVKQIPTIPTASTQPDNYQNFMAFFGFHKEYTEWNLFRVHWKNFMDFYNERIAEGKPEVPGIDVSKNGISYDLKLRKKQSIPFE